MVVTLKKKFLKILHRPYPLSIAILTCLIGYSIIYFYAYNQNKIISTKTNYLLISKLDGLFNSLDSIANLVKMFSKNDCSSIKPELQNIINTESIPLSITISKNNAIYCSSDSNITVQDLPPKNSQHLRLKLSDQNTFLLLWNNLLFFKKNISTQQTIFISLNDQQALQEILSSEITSKVINLEFDNATLAFHNIINPAHLYNQERSQSLQMYNYRITSGDTSPLVIVIIMNYYKMLLLITFLSIGIYFLTNWLLYSRSGAYYELKSAIKNNQITPYVQPVFNTQTGEIAGIEVLARWTHPKVGTIPPTAFIPIAEDTGLIILLTKKFFETVAQQFLSYIDYIPKDFRISFNISQKHCEDLQILEDCQTFYNTLNHSSLTLILELTERQLIEVTPTTKHLFHELHKIGVKIALDDFGVGNSNLSYLNDFAIDYLKIDKSFISRIGSDALSRNILDIIIDITQQCKIDSCAEGVENKEQLDYLRKKSVPYVQGFYFSEALPIDDFFNTYFIQNC